MSATAKTATWSFLTNHSHVIVCLTKDPEMRVRDLALQIGITERAVIRILGDLEQEGVIERIKKGRRNHYVLHLEQHLQHPLENHSTIGDLIRSVT